MIINLLLGVLLLLGIVWIALSIAYFWRLFQELAVQSGKNTPKQKGNGVWHKSQYIHFPRAD